MSYDNNNFDNSNNFQNDPNFGRQRGTGTGADDGEWDMGTFQNQGGNMRQQGEFGGQQGFQDQSGLGGQSGFGTQSAYQGNTTDSNTFGTGDVGETGRMSGQHRGAGDSFNQGSQQGWDNAGTGAGTGTGVGGGGFNDDYDNDSNNFGSGGQPGQQQHNKPSMGDKLKGGMEKLAGKVTRNEGMVERGQERKEGDFDQQNY